jgi:hydrogenase expression/formation protein HypC
MCLAVPGRIIAQNGADATVDFQGSRVDVSLALTPDARVGDWVLVHAGFAISQLDEAEARETWSYLAEAGLVEEMPAEISGGATLVDDGRPDREA